MGLLDDFRLNIGDVTGSGVVVGDDIIPVSGLIGSLLTMDLRTDLGDDAAATSGVTGVGSSFTHALRTDVGDEIINNIVQAPVLWGYTIVTNNIYDKQPNDVILFVNPTIAGTTIINLGPPPQIGRLCIIKDMKGDAKINNIIVRPASGYTIDSFNEFRLTQNYQSIMITWNGTEWNIV